MIAIAFWMMLNRYLSYTIDFMTPYNRSLRCASILIIALSVLASNANGQNKTPMVRLAKIVVDSSRLDEYKAILKEEAEKSVQLEPGVLTLYAVSEKEKTNAFYHP